MLGLFSRCACASAALLVVACGSCSDIRIVCEEQFITVYIGGLSPGTYTIYETTTGTALICVVDASGTASCRDNDAVSGDGGVRYLPIDFNIPLPVPSNITITVTGGSISASKTFSPHVRWEEPDPSACGHQTCEYADSLTMNVLP